MKTNSLIQLTKQLAVLTGTIGLSTLLSVPAMANPPVNQAESSAGMAHGKQNGTTNTDTAKSNLVQVASGNASFSTLVQAVQAAGLVNTLSGKGPFTIFAPTDTAFAALPKGAVELLVKPENKKLLQQLLTYHVVSGRLTANKLKTGNLKALGGGLAVLVKGDRVIVNDASVTQANVQASNGVIHAVDRVLMPRQLRQTIVSKLKAQ